MIENHYAGQWLQDIIFLGKDLNNDKEPRRSTQIENINHVNKILISMQKSRLESVEYVI